MKNYPWAYRPNPQRFSVDKKVMYVCFILLVNEYIKKPVMWSFSCGSFLIYQLTCLYNKTHLVTCVGKSNPSASVQGTPQAITPSPSPCPHFQAAPSMGIGRGLEAQCASHCRQKCADNFKQFIWNVNKNISLLYQQSQHIYETKTPLFSCEIESQHPASKSHPTPLQTQKGAKPSPSNQSHFIFQNLIINKNSLPVLFSSQFCIDTCHWEYMDLFSVVILLSQYLVI